MGTETKKKTESHEMTGEMIINDDFYSQASTEQDDELYEEPKLSGAFISSLIVGAIIIIMWVAVYLLYLSS